MKEPASFGGSVAYDAVMLLVNAIERVIDKGGKVTSAGIRDELERTKNFVGISGVFNMSSTDHLGLTSEAYIVALIKGGDFQPLQ